MISTRVDFQHCLVLRVPAASRDTMRMMTFLAFVIFATLPCQVFAGMSNLESALRLKHQLFTDYDRLIRPVHNQSEAIEVNMTFHLTRIDNLDMISQTLKWDAWLETDWYDQLLTWNSSEYGGRTFLMVPQTHVWLPDYVIENDVSSTRALGNADTLVYIRSDGHVTWDPKIIRETSCKIDIQKYPFDRQNCTFYFLPWMTTRTRLSTTSVLDTIDFSEFQQHGEYTIEGSSVVVELSYMPFANDVLKGLRFTVVLKRRHAFYWMIMIFPMMTFPLLSPISFLVPVDCGEKITLSITVVLSYLVFIGSMNDAMPKLSDTVSLLVVYASIQTTISMLSVVASGLIICIHKLPLTYKPSCCNPKKSKPPKRHGKEEGDVKSLLNAFFACLQSKSAMSELNPVAPAVKEGPNEIKDMVTTDWASLARKLDKLCFAVFASLAVLVTVIFAILLSI